MKHLYEYEDEEIKSMMGDLEDIGHGPYVGYMWVGTAGGLPLGFLVIGQDEAECVNMIASSKILETDDLPYEATRKNLKIELKRSDSKSFVDYLTSAFEIGRINDAGHYAGFKAKGHKKMIKLWFDYYMMNPKYCYDQAKEYFTNADEVMSKEYPLSAIIEF